MSKRQISLQERFLLWPGIRWWGERNRFAAQGGLLWVLAIATEKSQPLLPVVESFAEEAQGVWRLRMFRLLHFMNQGLSLPDALQEVPGILPEEAIVEIRIGWLTGLPAEALKHAALKYARSQQGVGITAKRFLTYVEMLVIILFLLVGFVMYYIIPKFKRIFDDFGTELPTSTQIVVRAAESAYPVVIWGGVLFLVSKLLIRRSTHGHEEKFWASLFWPRFGIPDLLTNLRLAVMARESLVSVITELSNYHPQRSIRRKLAQVQSWIAHGGTCWQALQNQKLIKPNETAMLESAERLGNLDWMLNETAEMLERRSEYVARRRMELLQPAIILLIGSIVGFYAIGMFMPLVMLILDLA
jgi:protein transport protein HofC